ncbi:MAG: TlpA disulfide reductase family protein [Agriterribacter sp.]
MNKNILVVNLRLLSLLAILCCYVTPLDCVGQRTKKFTIAVNYKINTGNTLYAGESHFLKGYRAATFSRDSISADSSRYFFMGELLYPTAIRLYTLSGKPEINHLFFIDSGYQEFDLSVYDSTIIIYPKHITKVQEEYLRFMKQMGISKMEEKIPEIKLNEYVKDFPASYIALFALAYQAFNYNFSPELKHIALCFDSVIKTTKGFMYFSSQYIERKKIPPLKLHYFKKNVQVDFNRQDGKYTFVEFWFTGCAACIPVMSYLKLHYRDLSQKVHIITVCTDEAISKGALKMLKKLSLPWKNYWDYSAMQFEDYALLYSYPANILINDKGYIIGKNIDCRRIIEFILSQ